MDWTTIKTEIAQLDQRPPVTPELQGWRCLEEWAQDPAVRALLAREFMVAPEANDHVEGLKRREFLKLIGGTLGLAGLTSVTGCTVRPYGKIVPYVNQPEEIIPGKPLYYATALEFCGFGRGVLVETHEGRPTKVEGNPDHPASLGATSVFEQAAILDLYNPARSSSVLKEGEIATWEAFNGALQEALASLPPGGKGLHLLTGRITSPSIAGLWAEIGKRYPEAAWHVDEPIDLLTPHGATLGAPTLHLDKAEWVISFGSDFLYDSPASVRYARDLLGPRLNGDQDPRRKERRLIVLESVPTITGTFADDRLALSPSEIVGYAAALAREWGVEVDLGTQTLSPEAKQWAGDIARGRFTSQLGLVVAGGDQPAELHQIVARLNDKLRAYEQGTLSASYLGEAMTSHAVPQSLASLVNEMEAGRVEILIMLGGNRVVTSPDGGSFKDALGSVPLTIHSDLYRDETALAVTWHLPLAHPFEAWGDTRAFEGTASLVQPLILPLYGGRSFLEVLDYLLSPAPRSAWEIVRAHWVGAGHLSEEAWRRALHDGVVVEGAPLPRERLSVDHAPISLPPAGETDWTRQWTLLFRPDPGLWDGRYAQNAWLQELPRPINKLSWENAFLISPESAAKAHLSDGSLVRITEPHGESVVGKVLVQPGMAAGVVAVTLGGGLWPEAQSLGKAVPLELRSAKQRLGINAYPLRQTAALWQTPVKVEKVGQGERPITTQKHHLVEGRDILRYGTETDLRARYPQAEKVPTLYNLTETMTDGVAWAMSIDLSRCIACNTCVVACQAENNIPPVGATEVARGREMYWMRLDTYYFGSPDRPFIAHQPVACMHCETAPCEIVCPVAATLHDHQGLNLQVYNRCIGTRYCSNNCPYKVRRFNFFRYAEEVAREPLQLMANPDVTIRARGVMEKCTYCVQRISAARIQSSVENRAIRDGEVIPACVQACPTEALLFGNANDHASRIASAKKDPLDYGLLADLSTRPRTTYIARVVNPLHEGQTE